LGSPKSADYRHTRCGWSKLFASPKGILRGNVLMAAATPASKPSSARPLLRVRDLVTSFRTDEGVLRAVDGVSFDVPAKATIGLVGESGCGKSVTSLSILRLIPPPGKIESGKIIFDGKNLLELPEREMRALRG